MTLILLFLFLLLDLQHPALPDIPYQEFTVTDLTELAWSGCSMNPMDGYENIPADLTVDWADTFKEQTNPSPTTTLQDLGLQNTIAPMRMIPNNIGIPVMPPDPELPQPIATPEPPPIAILTITGLALLYLIFGYSRRLRQYR
jgi:hypothetical protein